MPADIKIDFGEWLPDLPDLDNPGLTEAKNVVYYDGAYRPYQPLNIGVAAGSGNALQTLPSGSTAGTGIPYSGIISHDGDTIIVSIDTASANTQVLYRAEFTTGAWTTLCTANGYNGGRHDFAIFGSDVVAVNGTDVPVVIQNGFTVATNLATAGSAPVSRVTGTVGQFLFLANTYDTYWSAIDDHRNWPTPGSVTANSVQSGTESLRPDWGAITFIDGNDQFGLIFQERGITRITYVGGSDVWQFDELEDSKGTSFRKGVVRYGGVWYYVSDTGFYVTDGVTSRPIGANKVDNKFISEYVSTRTSTLPIYDRVWGAVDIFRKVIFWAYSTQDNGYANRIIAYSIENDRFTECDQEMTTLISGPAQGPEVTNYLFHDSSRFVFWAFDTANSGRRFSATAGTATLTTSEQEMNPGGRSFVRGVKSLVQWPTAITVNKTIALGTRDTQEFDSLSYTAEVTANTRSGFSDFRSDARYHRARTKITGDFESATGLEVKIVRRGDV